MTDAIGEWALLHHESGRPVWEAPLRVNDQADLDMLVAEARADGDLRMRVDDVTLVRLTLDH